MGLFLLAGVAGALPSPAAAPGAFAPAYSVTLTGYNAVPWQTDSSPTVTASGAYANPEVVAARSQDLGDELPFGTIIALQGPSDDSSGTCGYKAVGGTIGYRVIADTMNARYTNRIDVLFGKKDTYVLGSGVTRNAAGLLGVCPGVAVRVVGFVDISNPGKLPKSQADLAALVGKGSPLALNK